MDHQPESKTAPEPQKPDLEGRRRALKVVGAAALAVPVIETLTGKDLLNITAQAQTIGGQGFGGPFSGGFTNAD